MSADATSTVTMEALPDEILLQVAAYLGPLEVVDLSVTSGRFRFLLEDKTHWRDRCYDDSKASLRKRREELFGQQSSRLAALVEAVNELSRPAVLDASQNTLNGLSQSHRSANGAGGRRAVSWDPAYATEQVNFYQEYIHRHAPIRLSWFEGMSGREATGGESREALGASVFYESNGVASKLYAPLDDGSIGVWNAQVSSSYSADGPGQRLASSSKNLLAPESHSLRPNGNLDTVECVSIDRYRRRGYFAVANDLVEVDLETLQPLSRHQFPWQISAMSEPRSDAPFVIGTTHTLHLFDPRVQANTSSSPAVASVTDYQQFVRPERGSQQLINSPTRAPRRADLAQPGPLSILHQSEAQCRNSVWVAGRFTHLLNYELRSFPRIRGTIHSGARISSLTSLPYPCISRSRNGSMNQSRLSALNSTTGTAIVAAGAYKGKGSLEMYSFLADPRDHSLYEDIATMSGREIFTMSGTNIHGIAAKNRQTASSTKLLSVANHGLKIAYSDGNATIKWVERDGFTSVRDFSVAATRPRSAGGFIDQGHESVMEDSLWARDTEGNDGDVVQKLIPTLQASQGHGCVDVPKLHEDNLIIWTGDGKLGLVGFGKNVGWDEEMWEERAELAEGEFARLQDERAQGLRMRRALQWQADEARFMQGMGLPFASSW